MDFSTDLFQYPRKGGYFSFCRPCPEKGVYIGLHVQLV